MSTTNPTWKGLGLNPGLHSQRPLTTRAVIQPSTNKAQFIHITLFSVVQPCISIGRYKNTWPRPSKYSRNQRNSHRQYDENLKPNAAKYIIQGLRLYWHC